MKLLPPVTPGSKSTAKLSRGDKDRELMTVSEVTALLHCHRITLLRLIRRSQLHLFKSGSTRNFRRAEVNALSKRNIAIFPHLTIVRH